MRDLKSGMGECKVNGRTYKFDLRPPMEAIDLGSRVLKAAGGALVSSCGEGEVHYDAIAKALSVVEASELSALMKEALKRSYTPEQEPLSNEAVFHSWFNQNPQDLFVAGALAVFEQVRDFFPSGLSTAVRNSTPQR